MEGKRVIERKGQERRGRATRRGDGERESVRRGEIER